MIKNVIKRDGSTEPFDPDKLNKWAEYATKFKVDWSGIVFDTVEKLHDNVSTRQIHQAMIDACTDRKKEEYLHVASRLLRGDLYKNVYNSSVPDAFSVTYSKLVSGKHWQDFNLTQAELDLLDSTIDHSQDKTYEYASMCQFIDKYALSKFDEHGNKVPVETPQVALIGIALAIFKQDGMTHVINFYNIIKHRFINIATPIMAAARTGSNEWASCFVTTTGDNLDSIMAGTNLAYRMTANRAGIGFEYDVRSLGDVVGNDKCKHAGKIPHYKMLVETIKSVTQGCYDDKTELLTEKGWMFFEDVISDKTIKVAQVDDDQKITFVNPLEYFKYEVDEELYNFTQKGSNNKTMDLLVTGNHNMVFRKNTKTNDDSFNRKSDKSHYLSDDYSIVRADELKLSRGTYFDIGGHGTGNKSTLTPKERLLIAFQADGRKKVTGNSKQYAYSFKFKKQRKIDRLIDILNDNNIEFTTSIQKDNSTQFYCKVGYELIPDFSWIDYTNIDSNWCKEFLLELSHWDSSKADSSTKSYKFSSINKSCADSVQVIASMAGIYSNIRTSTNRTENRQDLYNVSYSLNRVGFTGRGLTVNKEHYKGYVYCVEVPTNKLIVRRNGKTVVCGNSRSGAATVSYNVMDPEIEDLLRIKHPTTPLAKRVELMDYSLVFNEEFRKRVAKNEDWLLISKVTAPDLHEAFYDKRDDFPELLEQYLRPHKDKMANFLSPTATVVKALGKVVKARDIASLFLNQRQDTGRIYSFNVDHANDHTPFKETVRLSNLCHEICLPTRGYSSPEALNKQHGFGKDGLVGLCFLLALDVGKIPTETMYEQSAYYACRALDNIITNMFYPFESLREVGENYRSIGIGITNLAYHMAKEDLLYDEDEGRNEIHKIAERHAYHLYKASNALAKERGTFGWYKHTKYQDGYLIIDSYNKEVDNHHSQELMYDWEELRSEIKKHGLRFSTHSAHMPCESSSVWSFGANGTYPIRSGLVMKSRPEGIVPFIPPEYEKLQYAYQFAWDISTKDLAKVYAIIQKFTDQAISADQYIDFSKKDGGKASMKELMQDWLFWYKLGNKTQYYYNTKTGNSSDSDDSDDGSCESCKL